MHGRLLGASRMLLLRPMQRCPFPARISPIRAVDPLGLCLRPSAASGPVARRYFCSNALPAATTSTATPQHSPTTIDIIRAIEAEEFEQACRLLAATNNVHPRNVYTRIYDYLLTLPTSFRARDFLKKYTLARDVRAKYGRKPLLHLVRHATARNPANPDLPHLLAAIHSSLPPNGPPDPHNLLLQTALAMVRGYSDASGLSHAYWMLTYVPALMPLACTFRPACELLQRIAYICILHRNVSAAESILSCIAHDRLHPDSVSALIIALCAKASSHESVRKVNDIYTVCALSWFNQSRQQPILALSKRAYFSLIYALIRTGDPSTAEQVMIAMHAANHSQDGRLYNALIAAYARDSAPATGNVVRLLEQMTRHGLKMDDWIRVTLATFHARLGNDNAEALFQDIEKGASNHDSATKSATLAVARTSLFHHVQLPASLLNGAQNTLEDLIHFAPNRVLLTGLLSHVAQTSDTGFESILRAYAPVLAQHDGVTDLVLITAWLRRGKFDHAWSHVLRRFNRPLPDSSSDNSEMGKVPLEIWHALLRYAPPNDHRLNIIIAALRGHENLNVYTTLIHRALMPRAANDVDADAEQGPRAAAKLLKQAITVGFTPDIAVYNTFLAYHARCANVPAANKVIATMKAAGIAPDVQSYTAVIHACVNAGDEVGVRRWLRRMKKAAIRPTRATAEIVSGLLPNLRIM